MKLRTGIFEEALALTNANQAKASSRFKEGYLYQIPPEVLYSIPIGIRKSWKKFHALEKFDWILKDIMPGGWVPRCTFVSDCTWYGKSNPPRLLYAVRENYVLNSPERFFCTFCSKNAKYQKPLGIPNNGRAQYSYLLTCNHILEHMRTEDLDVYLMFICTLQRRLQSTMSFLIQ